MKKPQLIIAVGTTSKQKIGYLEEVLRGLKIKAQIIPVAAKSGVADQPTTSIETKRGSINRAREAQKTVAEADLSLGIEVGYHRYKTGDYQMFCWVTMLDKRKQKFSTQSHRFLLPKYYQDLLRAGKYLANHLDDFKGTPDHTDAIDEIVRYRKPFITTALRQALLQIV